MRMSTILAPAYLSILSHARQRRVETLLSVVYRALVFSQLSVIVRTLRLSPLPQPPKPTIPPSRTKIYAIITPQILNGSSVNQRSVPIQPRSSQALFNRGQKSQPQNCRTRRFQTRKYQTRLHRYWEYHSRTQNLYQITISILASLSTKSMIV